jgi:hypothetical protein
MNAGTLIPVPPHPASPGGGWITAYPLCTFLELGAYPTAPGSARGHARNVLAEWRLGHLTDAVLTVVSELVSNSVTATRRAAWEAELPPVRLWLLGGPGGWGTGEVMVLVWDAVLEVPVARTLGGQGKVRQAGQAGQAGDVSGLGDVSELDESGRGLALVTALSAGWDFYHPPAPIGGKVTRALIAHP